MSNRRKNLTPVQRREIVELLKTELNVKKVARRLKLSTSTVYKIIQTEGGGPTLAGSDMATWALQMEQSGHWPGLREAAVTLDHQLRAPVQQLLGMPVWDERNESLVCDWSDNNAKVSLSGEKDELFRRLKEHLPTQGFLHLLEEWKSKVAIIHGGLDELCQWVLAQPGISDLPLTPPDSLVRNNHGISVWFAPTVVSNAVVDVYHDEPVDAFYQSSIEQEYGLSPPAKEEFWLLTWSQMEHSYVIASWENRDDLDNLNRRHIELRLEIRELEIFKSVVDDYRRLNQDAEELKEKLVQIANLAIFPGSCGLCKG